MKMIDFAQLPSDAEIAEAAVSPVHTDEYNRLYKEWRCREGNRFAFSGRRTQTRHVYIDGIGVREISPAGKERTALQNICLLIAVLMFVYSVMDNALGMLLMLIFRMFGVEISYSFHDSIAYGDQYAVLTYILVEGLFKLLIPILLAGKLLKMPAKIAAPVSMRSHWHFAGSISAVCVCFALLGAVRLAVPMGIFMTNNIGMTYGVITYMNSTCSAVYMTFDILIVPVLLELLFHGAMFQALRQFGVTFALLFTSALSTAVMHDPYSFLIIFVSSFIAGYGVWRSGSIITGIVVSCEVRILSFILYQCEELPDIAGIPAQWVCVAVMLALGLLGIFALSFTAKGKLHFEDYSTFIPGKEKLKICSVGSAMLAVWVLCLLLMIIEIVL